MILKFTMRDIAFLLLLCFIASIPMENAIVVDGVGRFSKLLGIASSGFWLLTVMISGSFRRPRFFHYLVLSFIVWNALSLFWTIDLSTTMTRVMTWAQLTVMIAVIWDLITTERELHLAYQAFVIGAYFSAFATISLFRSGEMYYEQRYAAAGFHPNGLGFILAMAVPIAWYVATDRSVPQLRIRRLFNLGYLAIATVAIALTGTRTAAIAAVPSVIYILLGKHDSRQSKTVVMSLVVLAVAVILGSQFVPASSFQRLATISSEIQSGDLNGRLHIWQTGFEVFRENSIVGVGTNSFKIAEGHGHVAHNAFISVAVELGAVGLLLFGAVVGLAFYYALRLPPRWSHFLLALLTTWALGSSALTWEHKKTTWLIMSFVIISVHLYERRVPVPSRKPLPAPVGQRPGELVGNI